VSPIQASLQRVFIECLQAMLSPIVRLTLYCGLGHSEFAAAAKRVFIEVASEEFGIRGIASTSPKTKNRGHTIRVGTQRAAFVLGTPICKERPNIL
jgi:hypothetical protein